MPANDRNIIERALDEIRPAPDRQSTCRSAIETLCRHLDRLRDYFADRPSPGELKTRVRRTTQSIGKTIDLITSLPADHRPLVFCALGGEGVDLSNLIGWHEWLDKLGNSLNVPSGGQRVPPLKFLAGYYAHDLLRRFSSKSPTITPEGPYLALAQILYESATGEQDADMRRACERVRMSEKEKPK